MTERAITAAAGELIEPDDEAEQLGLFEAPVTAAGLAHPRNQRRGPGRPLGARNKRTERSVAWLLQRHRDPRAVLLEIAEANVFDLAALLGCKPLEAMEQKRLAAIGVAPYVAARITPEVVDNRQVIHLTIHTGADGDRGGAGAGIVHVLDPAEFEPLAEGPSAVVSPDGGGNAGDQATIPAPSHTSSHNQGVR